jgi:hypothetical protein
MLPGRRARSPSSNRLGAHGSKTGVRSRDRVAALPAPAKTGLQNPSSCPCGRSPATRERQSEWGSSGSALRATPDRSLLEHIQNPPKRRRVNVAADDHPPCPAQNNHHLSGTHALGIRIARRFSPLLRRRLTGSLRRRHNRRHKSSDRATVPFAVCLAPSEQERVRYPVPARRRRHQSRRRKALLNDPQLLFVRPAATPARIDNLKPRDATTISKDIHTDSQLQPDYPRKAVLTECVP